MRVSRIIAVAGAVLIFLVAVGEGQRVEAQTAVPAIVSTAPANPSIGMPTVAAVQVTAPAEQTTSASIGSWLGDFIAAMAAIFGPIIATFLTQWVIAVAKKAGVDASQAMADRLDQIMANGLHYGAKEAQVDLAGKMTVEIRNKVLANAVTYAQVNGSKLIAGMANPATVDELQARAAKMLSKIGPDQINAPAVAPAPPVVSQGMTRSGEIVTSVQVPTEKAS